MVPDELKKTGEGYFSRHRTSGKNPGVAGPCEIRGRQIPAGTDKGKIIEGGLGDQSEGNLVFVFIILGLH